MTSSWISSWKAQSWSCDFFSFFSLVLRLLAPRDFVQGRFLRRRFCRLVPFHYLAVFPMVERVDTVTDLKGAGQ